MPEKLNFKIGGIKKSSLLDFPDKLSAIVFTQGCNFRCGFCHNPSLMDFDGAKNSKTADKIPHRGLDTSEYSAEKFLNFLETRRNKLDGAVITGGEPSLQKDLKPFIQKIKSMGFLVKLDTNGSRPEVINDLLQSNLLDYIAMDIKAPLEKYQFTVNTCIDTAKIKESIDLIMHSGIKYEFRTTFMPYYHKMEDFEKTGQLIKGAERYYLQKFEAKSEINNPKLKDEKNYSDEEILSILKILRRYIPSAALR